ncbi:MAG: hypothetical protein AB7I38_08860 [Dehalococcoidia bacterium]
MRANARWLLPSALLLVAVGLLLVTYLANPFGLGDGEPAAATAEASASPGSYLFVQTASGGTLRDLGDGTFTLELRDVAPRSTYFSDRPERDAGTMDPARMLSDVWEADIPPPNAALVATTAGNSRVTLPLELTNPTYDPSAATMTFDADLLEELPGSLQDLGLAEVGSLADDFTEAELFIDTTFNHCVIALENYTNRSFQLRSKDPPDGNRWGPGDPPDGINGGGSVQAFKFKYRSEEADKTGTVVYEDILTPTRTLTIEVTCHGDLGAVVSATARTTPSNDHHVAITFPSGNVRFVVYDSGPLSVN